MKITALVITLLLLFCQESSAAEADIRGASVIRTLFASGERWGGCMALLDQEIAAAGLDCPGRWVTFSCTGDFAAKDVAYKMFDTAQMVYALDRRVFVTVDDSRKHNGYCYASRIDTLP